jgi:hypothetical protein
MILENLGLPPPSSTRGSGRPAEHHQLALLSDASTLQSHSFFGLAGWQSLVCSPRGLKNLTPSPEAQQRPAARPNRALLRRSEAMLLLPLQQVQLVESDSPVQPRKWVTN